MFGFGKKNRLSIEDMKKSYIVEGLTNEGHKFRTLAQGINEEFALCHIGNAGFVIEYAGSGDNKELKLIPMSQIKCLTIKVKRC